MDGIQLKPRREQITLNVILLGALCAVSLGMPAVGVACALLTPLCSCPLLRHREEWLGWICCAAPAVGALLAGFDPVIALGMSLPALCPTVMARALPIQKRVGGRGVCLHCAMTALGLGAFAALLTWRLGAPLHQALPAAAVSAVEQSTNPGLTLYRLAKYGLVALPENQSASQLLSRLLHPQPVREMLLSLRRTVEMAAMHLLPLAFSIACVLVGVFTALRVERLNGVMLVVERDPEKPLERKTRVMEPPGFRMFTLSGQMRIACVILLCPVLFLTERDTFSYTFIALCTGAVGAVFMLVGAAVVTFRLCKGAEDEGRTIVSGIIATLVCFLFPMLVSLIGVSDGFMHYRTTKVRQADSDE